MGSTGSTNADLIAFAKSGAATDRLWLVAGEQTAGMGRRGRAWVSPPGNLYASLYLEHVAETDSFGFTPLVCAVAVHRAIRATIGEKFLVQIKWPNDILIDGAKCCGMLIEADNRDYRNNLVIGCGINLVAHPHDTPYPAVHLNALGASVSTNEMFQYLSEAFAQTFDEWDRGKNSAAIRAYWSQHARGINETMTVNFERSSIDGICEGIDARGFLLLRAPDGTRHEISAGDVFFPQIKK
ncbi:MAG: biotin--[acetyl-CoA-carboxylase] ligase [Ahrensia sp.]|nr:biotin--[acetyl-CoA-carboxylase] ligase [Ahrensia sp.]